MAGTDPSGSPLEGLELELELDDDGDAATDALSWPDSGDGMGESAKLAITGDGACAGNGDCVRAGGDCGCALDGGDAMPVEEGAAGNGPAGGGKGGGAIGGVRGMAIPGSSGRGELWAVDAAANASSVVKATAGASGVGECDEDEASVVKANAGASGVGECGEDEASVIEAAAGAGGGGGDCDEDEVPAADGFGECDEDEASVVEPAAGAGGGGDCDEDKVPAADATFGRTGAWHNTSPNTQRENLYSGSST